MNTRTILSLAAALALAVGCDHAPVGVLAPDLIGHWQSDVTRFTATIPDGERTLERVETWDFSPDGTYLREAWLLDSVSGRAYVDYVDEGGYAVPRPGSLTLTPRTSFYRLPTQFVTTATPLPSSGLVLRYGFSVEDGVLSVLPGCPENADCLPPTTLRLHAVPVRLD